jgi:uncharacterized protein with HEPN domain
MTGLRYGPKVEQCVRDLIDFSDQAARLVANGKDAYESNEWLQLSAEALMHKIGETIARIDEFARDNKLAPSVVLDYPDIDWRKMKATRNVVAHRYDNIDYSILWQGLSEDLPRDATRLRALLDSSRELRSNTAKVLAE